MTMWRILEVTILNRYFNSLKTKPGYERMLSYVPPDQTMF